MLGAGLLRCGATCTLLKRGNGYDVPPEWPCNYFAGRAGGSGTSGASGVSKRSA